SARSHEPPQVRVDGAALLGRLLLEGAERVQVALGGDDLLDGRRADSANQLVLQIANADVEAEGFHLRPVGDCADTRPLEATAEVAHLADVTQAGQRQT